MLRQHIYISDRKFSFKDVFNEFYASQVLFASKIIKNLHDSEDIVQEVFLSIWKSKPVFKNEIAFRAYIYLSTRNKCIDYLRKKKPFFESVDKAENIENEIDILIREEAYRLLDKAISALPNQTREIMKFAMKGLSVQEIAEELKISVNTVKTLKSRAYKALKETYGDVFMFVLFTLFSS